MTIEQARQIRVTYVEKNDLQQLMEEAPVWGLVRKLCIPTVAITLVMALYSMASIFFVGRTGDVEMVSALSVSIPALMVVQALGSLVGTGGCVAASLELGKDDMKGAQQITSLCFWFSIVMGVFAALAGVFGAEAMAVGLGAAGAQVEYAAAYLRITFIGSPIMILAYSFMNVMRADGSARESLIANLSGTVLNIALAGVLILIFEQGVIGAAVATIIGNLVTLLISVKQARMREHFSFSLADARYVSRLVDVVKLGLPTAAGTILVSVAYIAFNNILITSDPNATGAFGVSRSVMLFSTMVQMGICLGTQPAISYCHAKGNGKRVREIVKATALATVLFGLAVAVLSLGFRHEIASAFGLSGTALIIATHLLVGCMVTAPVYGVFQICAVYLQSTDKAAKSTVLTLLRQGIILIPAFYVLNALGGFDTLVFSFAATDIIAALVGVTMVAREALGANA